MGGPSTLKGYRTFLVPSPHPSWALSLLRLHSALVTTLTPGPTSRLPYPPRTQPPFSSLELYIQCLADIPVKHPYVPSNSSPLFQSLTLPNVSLPTIYFPRSTNISLSGFFCLCLLDPDSKQAPCSSSFHPTPPHPFPFILPNTLSSSFPAPGSSHSPSPPIHHLKTTMAL